MEILWKHSLTFLLVYEDFFQKFPTLSWDDDANFIQSKTFNSFWKLSIFGGHFALFEEKIFFMGYLFSKLGENLLQSYAS